MTYECKPQGCCAQLMVIDMDDDNIIEEVKFVRGCPGNLLGISSMVKGMKAEHVIERFKGVRCGAKATSCPDQFAKALEGILGEKKAD